MNLDTALDLVLDDLRSLRSDLEAKEARTGSRYVAPGADPSLVEHVARGGEIEPTPRAYRYEREPSWSTTTGKKTGGGLAHTMTKALAESTNSAGGYLVDPEVADDVLRLVRARSAVNRIGPTVVPVDKSLGVTSIATGSTAYYVAENAAIPTSEMTFAETPILEPKDLAAMVPVSNRLLRDATSNPDLDAVLRSDLAEVIALRGDLAFLRGTGTGGEPTGWRNVSGLTPGPSTGTNGSSPTFDMLKEAVANLRAAGGTFLKPAWIFHPRLLSSLEVVKDTTGRYLAESELLTFDATGGGGKLLGIPFATTTQIPVDITTGSSTDTTEVFITSDAQEMWIGEGSSLEIERSGEASYTPDGGTTWVSAFQNRQTVFRAVVSHDVALRRASWFSVITGVRP